MINIHNSAVKLKERKLLLKIVTIYIKDRYFNTSESVYSIHLSKDIIKWGLFCH